MSRLKNTVGWFFMREKYCSGWKNKPNKTDYKSDEQGQRLLRPSANSDPLALAGTHHPRRRQANSMPANRDLG
jgi:hypothetical protein